MLKQKHPPSAELAIDIAIDVDRHVIYVAKPSVRDAGVEVMVPLGAVVTSGSSGPVRALGSVWSNGADRASYDTVRARRTGRASVSGSSGCTVWARYG